MASIVVKVYKCKRLKKGNISHKLWMNLLSNVYLHIFTLSLLLIFLVSIFTYFMYYPGENIPSSLTAFGLQRLCSELSDDQGSGSYLATDTGCPAAVPLN